jgi:hypothetical protein
MTDVIIFGRDSTDTLVETLRVMRDDKVPVVLTPAQPKVSNIYSLCPVPEARDPFFIPKPNRAERRRRK